MATFREILAQDAGDGMEFDADALRVDHIREELEYSGLRLRTTASISGARINLTIDIGFGDALEPGAEELDYPSMLDFPIPDYVAMRGRPSLPRSFRRWWRWGVPTLG